MVAEAVSATCLVLLGLAHSVLGEAAILRPLCRAEWAVEMPRWVFERIARFAWHMTSFAWFALAAVLAGVDVRPAAGAMSLVCAAVVFVVLRGHLAWPLFLLAGLAAFYAYGWIDARALEIGALATSAVLVALAALHVWWAVGGTWMLDRALPPIAEGGFRPGRWLTLAVAAALAVFGVLVALAGLGEDAAPLRWLLAAGILTLALRAVGDTKVAGFTKTVRDTAFGRADDRYFTPLVVFLALGATGSLLIG
ncbi:MAG: DUF3995 domain-containing protein [Nocardioides sp.]